MLVWHLHLCERSYRLVRHLRSPILAETGSIKSFSHNTSITQTPFSSRVGTYFSCSRHSCLLRQTPRCSLSHVGHSQVHRMKCHRRGTMTKCLFHPHYFDGTHTHGVHLAHRLFQPLLDTLTPLASFRASPGPSTSTRPTSHHDAALRTTLSKKEAA